MHMVVCHPLFTVHVVPNIRVKGVLYSYTQSLFAYCKFPIVERESDTSDWQSQLVHISWHEINAHI